MQNRHIPVLLAECLSAFAPIQNGVIVDCTLGGAGHTHAILEKYPNLKILGVDMDFQAISAARLRLEENLKRVEFFNGNFAELLEAKIENPEFQSPWSGVLMDLGYSSNQLESAQYGMSFMIEGKLDMRLARREDSKSANKYSAWDILNQSTAEELGELFAVYGEMNGAYRTARQIKEGLAFSQIQNSTLSLARFLESKNSGTHKAGRKSKIHPATLVFQALRIAVNDELRVLDHFLENVIFKLRVDARIAVITFHSLEDRIVKRWGKAHEDRLVAITKKPVIATDEEVQQNPRARSAKLRVYQLKRV